MIKRNRQPSSNFDLANRDHAERIWLWRHRQESELGTARGRRAGAMSQAEAAAKLGLTMQQYHQLESGDTTLFSAEDLAEMWPWMSEVFEDDDATTSELCFLARRRAGQPLVDAARAMGISNEWFLRLEDKGDARMVKYWQHQGFRFPKGRRPVIARPGKVIMRPGKVPEPHRGAQMVRPQA
jgi:transcriptional regulator with XRE-family HTH domain